MPMQFYPTPKALAEKAWAKFKNRSFVRVLEPSAGEGHLLSPAAGDGQVSAERIDCIEIDITKHDILRKKGFNVVGIDFMRFQGPGAIYSHIIMNPPFAYGAQHVLKAWDLLCDGEIVAILNAETVRNPFSKEREMLAHLIEKHGSVEFIEGAFSGTDAQRKTHVDVALVYLRKESSFDSDLVGDIMQGLKIDTDLDTSCFVEQNELAIPANLVENAVLRFNAAVKAMRESVLAEARAAKYAALIGKTIEQLNSEMTNNESSLMWVREELHKRYSDLKNRAWTSIIRSTEVMARLSSSTQKRIESEFEKIKKLEFSVPNIYGFLAGLVAKQKEIQISMACDVFDLITRYHTENTVYYMGWKSNDAHRTCGMRIKTTRFVIPGHATEPWQRNLPWDSIQMLSDFDKVFAMLDGKTAPDISLVHVFTKKFNELRSGSRVTSSYFDVRYYPKRGTIHFFPRDKKLIDRLNRLVGRHRSWLPPEDQPVSKDFWLQFEQAEKFDAEIRKEVASRNTGFGDPFWKLTAHDSSEKTYAVRLITDAISAVLEQNGINPHSMLVQTELPLLQA